MNKNVVTLFEVKVNYEGIFCVPKNIMTTCKEEITNNRFTLYSYLRDEAEDMNEDCVEDVLTSEDIQAIADYINYGYKVFKIRDLGVHGNTHVLDYAGIIVKYIAVIVDGKDADGDEEYDFEEDYQDDEQEEECSECTLKDLCSHFGCEEDDEEDEPNFYDEDEDDCDYRGDGANDPDQIRKGLDKEKATKTLTEIESQMKEISELVKVGVHLRDGYKDALKELDKDSIITKVTESKLKVVVASLDMLEERANTLKNIATQIMLELHKDNPMVKMFIEEMKEAYDELRDEEEDEVDFQKEIDEIESEIQTLINKARKEKEEKIKLKELLDVPSKYINTLYVMGDIHEHEEAQEEIQEKIKELRKRQFALNREKARKEKEYRNEKHTGYFKMNDIIKLFFGKDLY